MEPTPADWQPIETAPTAWTREHSFDLDGRTITIRNGPVIKVKGPYGPEIEGEAIACWAQQQGFNHGQEPHWWNLTTEEPLVFPPTLWRALTPGEEAQLDHLGNTDAPADGASPPPPPPLPPAVNSEILEARKQVFGWAWRAHGGSLAKWADRWGRIMWLSGQPEGTDPDGVITADLGDGWTLNQDLALDWDLNRPSYTRLAASLIRQMAKEAGYEIKGEPI
jgi:hypothetical protein